LLPSFLSLRSILILFFHLYPLHPILFSLGFQTKLLYAFQLPMCTTCPSSLLLRYSVYILSFSLLQYPAFSYFLPDIYFLQHPLLKYRKFSLMVRDQVSHLYQIKLWLHFSTWYFRRKRAC
jgi:hypothetical protein